MKTHLVPLARRPALALLLALAAAACGGGDDRGGPVQPETTDTYPYPVGRITLSYMPVDLDRVVNFHGLGNLNVLPEDHGAFFTPKEGWSEESTIPVYAPASGKIIRLGHDLAPWFAPYSDDYRLQIRVSTTMKVGFGHLPAVADDILEQAGTLVTGYGETKDVGIEVEAGQIIGYAGTQGALDFYIKDTSIRSALLNKDRYPEDFPYAGCYHDCFPEPLRNQLLAITERTVEPRCGKIDFDVAGRIVGNWFKDDAPADAFSDVTSHLAIVYGYMDGDRIAISDGFAKREIPVPPTWLFWVKGNAPRPETVGVAEGLVKYELMQAPPQAPTGVRPPLNETIVGVFLVQMLEPGRIQVERVMGKTADEVEGFSENARLYLR